MSKKESALYSRIFLFVLGSLSLGFAVYLLVDVWPSVTTLVLVIIAGFAIFGLALIVNGVSGSDKKVEKVASDASMHEYSIVVLIIIYPIYFLVKKVKSHNHKKKK